MRILTGSLIVIGMLLAGNQAAAEDISAQARRIADNRSRMADLSKNDVKIGENIEMIGSLSFDEFLQLEAIPDGMDPVSAQAMYKPEKAFDFMTPKQAMLSVAVMRKNGIALPEDLEKKIKKDPDNASTILFEAFSEIQPADVDNKEEAAEQRRKVIRQSENMLGISFKSLVEAQKMMMTTIRKKQ